MPAQASNVPPAGQARATQRRASIRPCPAPRELIEDAKNYRIQSITVAGYADPLGTEAYNKSLSLQRATTVRDYLKQRGFPDLDIKVEGRGATDLKKTLADCPGTGNNDPQQIQCLAEDRRVQIEAVVLPK
jgi:outer membrane protein OmpA-like peptidoglycan-associated protein